ncbi:MAG: bifunctional homocysteine S-methyltransferase/methylenetetrahydrofolate reductase [Bdellovibrionaceae bacterium]|nr:bifunctional homocysteine S-methyltransferase/methylenetetrahydrofolate reductase [Pseudobdellovibrionaceae bacterium]
MKVHIKEYLKKDSPIVADGGMVTALYDKGFYINRSFEELSVTDPQAVREVTKHYKTAGAKFLKTNTFNAVEPKLVNNGLQGQCENILRAACKVTKEVAGEDAYVLGAIGPLGVVIEPLGPTSVGEAKDYFKKNIEVFVNEEVDAILFTSFHDLRELETGLMAAKEVDPNFMIFAQISVQESMKTSFGSSMQEFVELTNKYNVDVIGISGEVGPSGSLTATTQLSQLTDKPLYIAPNAGLPRYVNDEYIYMCNPDYMGKYAKRIVQAGAKIIGGHSGVHEPHILAIANALRMTQGVTKSTSKAGLKQQLPSSLIKLIDKPQKKVAIRERSSLGKYLADRKKIVSVEVVPPNGVDIDKFLDHCQALEEGGVNFINIPDGARAVARMSSLQLSSYISQKYNLEPIPHFTTRDRNLIGLQSDLLGAYVNGVRNVLIVTGDPPKLGNCPGATAVYDVDAIGLTHIMDRMNQGLDLGGNTFGKPSQFLLGVALNPTASNRELEIQRFKYKIEAGADFAITQPIYSLKSYKEFFEELGEVKIPIIMGIWPLISLRNAEFLKNEVPGVDVPDWVISEMEKANGDKEEALKRGMDIAMKTIGEAQGLVAGFQVSAPFNKVDVAIDVIKATM